MVLGETLEFTHAFFPGYRFARVEEKNGWVFGRKNEGYIAIFSGNGYRWQQEGEYAGSDLIADGRKNAWVVEMGRKATHGSFDEFIQSISGAPLTVRGLNVSYESPSLGRVESGWRGPLRIEGKTVATSEYGRYENPSCSAAFANDVIKIRHGEEELELGCR